MATVQLIPPDSGNNSITFDGRTYASTPGIAIPVPDFDASVLQANGWVIQPTTPETNSTTSTVTAATSLPVVTPGYYFQTIVNPQTPSQATVQGILGEAIYPALASLISSPGHIIGSLGHLTNNNVTYTLPGAIGIEGRIDNFGTITTATTTNCNLGENLGTITTWYGAFSAIAANAGTITGAAGYGLDITSNTGTIGSYYGYYFPTLSAPANIPLVIGFFFNNNPGITGAKYAYYCADPTAMTLSLGPITTQGSLTAATFHLDTGTKTATAVAGAATLNKASGKITTESLTMPAGAAYTLTLTNSQIAIPSSHPSRTARTAPAIRSSVLSRRRPARRGSS